MRTVMMILTLALLLAACGQQGGEESAQTAAPPPGVSQASPAVETAPAPVESAAGSPPAAAPEPAAPAVTAVPAPAPAPSPAAPAGAVLERDAALALAQQSGCLACHKIETKLVGPSWQDVSAKYKDDAGARAMLVAKVKAGGQGNWTAVTGGMPMPPYSPRVSDEHIEQLVAFILSL